MPHRNSEKVDTEDYMFWCFKRRNGYSFEYFNSWNRVNSHRGTATSRPPISSNDLLRNDNPILYIWYSVISYILTRIPILQIKGSMHVDGFRNSQTSLRKKTRQNRKYKVFANCFSLCRPGENFLVRLPRMSNSVCHIALSRLSHHFRAACPNDVVKEVKSRGKRQIEFLDFPKKLKISDFDFRRL